MEQVNYKPIAQQVLGHKKICTLLFVLVFGLFGVVRAQTDALTISANGNVGIDISNPQAQLHISASGLSNTDYAFRTGGNGKFSIDSQGTIGGRMIVTHDGKVGIGTNSPQYPMEIKGSVPQTYSSFYFVNGAGDAAGGTGNGVQPITLKVEATVAGAQFFALSDHRAKQIVSRSNTDTDLQTLLGLKITDYHYIDKPGKGSAIKKGIIAQEVEEVFPQAVSRSKDYIPNIFQLAESFDYDESTNRLTVTVAKAHDLTKGDLIRFETQKGQKIATVSTVKGENTFIVSNWETKPNQLFVYGKQVDDFRTVDYDQLFSLGLSSIQELHGEIERLKTQVQALKGMTAEASLSADPKPVK